MRWLGVDLGARRIGLAYAEDDEGPALLLRTVTIAEGGALVAIRSAAAEVHADALVVGLPLEMSGREGLAARRARALGTRISMELKLPIAFVDERLTTTEAHRALTASAKSGKAKKAQVDQLAAKILLDTHLAIRANKGGHESA